MRRLLLGLLLLILLPSVGMAASDVGVMVRSSCSTIASPVANGTWCFQQSNGGLYTYNGSAWVGMTGDTVNIKSYGAKGDGTTDDTTAIQNAINSVPANGGWLIIPPPTSSYKITSGLSWSGHMGGGIIGPGAGMNGNPTFTWAGSAGGTMLTVTKSYMSRFTGFYLYGGANNKAAIILQLLSDNTPALVNNRFEDLVIQGGTTAGIDLKGRTTNQEEVSGSQFVNIFFKDNNVQYWQETGNSQDTIIQGGVFECSDCISAASGSVTYNIKFGGGSLYLYGVNFEMAKLADIQYQHAGTAGIWPGLYIYGAYSESQCPFLISGEKPYTGNVSLYDVNHVPPTLFAGVTASLQIDSWRTKKAIIVNPLLSGNIELGDYDQDVVIINPMFNTGPGRGAITGAGGAAIPNTPRITVVGGKDALSLGYWATPTFSAGNFTASSRMTWTVSAGNVTVYRSTMVAPRTMHVAFYIVNTTVGGTPSNRLFVKIPNSKTPARDAIGQLRYQDNGGTWTAGLIYATSGESHLALAKDNALGTNWTASSSNTAVQGEITFEIHN